MWGVRTKVYLEGSGEEAGRWAKVKLEACGKKAGRILGERLIGKMKCFEKKEVRMRVLLLCVFNAVFGGSFFRRVKIQFYRGETKSPGAQTRNTVWSRRI